MIFSRNRGSGRHSARRREPDVEVEELEGETGEAGESDETDQGAITDRDIGPYDITEAPDGIAQLDLGALRVPAVDGVEVRVQADNDGRIQQVVLVNGDSALQLGVFAAPRSEGIWDEVRAEIRKQLFNDGVGAEEVDGDYGPELRARVRTPEGLTDIRFVGVNGPRWLVRAVYQGPAAIDPTVAPPLVECLHNLVVDRGHEAMPVREPLPLRLPKEMEPDADGGVDTGGAPAAARTAPRGRLAESRHQSLGAGKPIGAYGRYLRRRFARPRRMTPPSWQPRATNGHRA